MNEPFHFTQPVLRSEDRLERIMSSSSSSSSCSGLVTFTVILFLTNYGSTTTASASLSFSLTLIHRNSSVYNHFDRLRAEALRSIRRANHFFSDDQSAIQSPLTVDGGGYAMKIAVGTPATEFLAIADTGSDLIWLRCDPCNQCQPQDAPLFKPQSSSTYEPLSCDSGACQALPPNRHTCSQTNTNNCVYSYSYGDRSFTRGILSSESFTFDSDASNTVAFPGFVFGCGYNNQGTFTSKEVGLVGLGGGPLSLVSQLGPRIDYKFSYCLVPRGSGAASKLSFGSDAVISTRGAVSTTLIKKSQPTFYYLNLEAISVGVRTVQAASRGGGNIIIDSGTTLTILEQSIYSELEQAVKEAIGAETTEDTSGMFKLCYSGNVRVLPEMVFHFTGADVTLKPINTFDVVDESGLMCMLMIPGGDEGMSIFGNYAQINFQVQYDLSGMEVSFAPTDCATATP